MPNIERLIKKLNHARGEVALRELESALRSKGFQKIRVSGSHFHYAREDGKHEHFPVHNNKVEAVYARAVVKRIGN